MVAMAYFDALFSVGLSGAARVSELDFAAACVCSIDLIGSGGGPVQPDQVERAFASVALEALPAEEAEGASSFLGDSRQCEVCEGT